MIKMISKYNDKNFGIYKLWYIYVLHMKFGSCRKNERIFFRMIVANELIITKKAYINSQKKF